MSILIVSPSMLDEVQPVSSSAVAAIAADPTVGAVQPVLRVGAQLSAPGSNVPIDLVLDVIDLQGELWAPSLVRGSLPDDGSGIVVSAEAAADLGQDPVTLWFWITRCSAVAA